MIQTLLILSVFAVSAVAMYRKKMNSLVGLPLMALAIALCAGISWQGIMSDVINDGALRLYNPMIVFIFGATLAELVKKSGIVEVLIKNTAEFMGDRLLGIALLLMVIIAVLFTVLAGLGAIVMVGSIVFPIMLSLGLSKKLSAGIFLVGLSLGGTLNLVNWSLYTEVLKLNRSEVLTYVLYFFPAALFISIFFVYWELRKESSTSFKLQLPPAHEKIKISIFAYLTPIIPVVLVLFSGLRDLFNPNLKSLPFTIISSIFIAIVWGTITAPKSAGSRVRLLTRSLVDGITQVAPALALMVGIGMLLKAVGHPAVKTLLGPWMKMLMPTSKMGYIVFFTLLAPLSLYRGPLNIWGMGSGLVVLMKDAGTMPPAAIMGALMAVGQIQGISDPTNTYNVWMANYLGTDVIGLMKKTLLYAWAMAVVGLMIAARMYFV